MQKIKISSLLYLPFFLLSIQTVKSSEECAAIVGDSERLKCYDSIYGVKKNIQISILPENNSTPFTQSNSLDKEKVLEIKEIFLTKTKKTELDNGPEEQSYFKITRLRIKPNGKYVIYSEELKFELNEYLKKSYIPKLEDEFRVYKSKFGGFRLKFKNHNREYKLKS
jgi:hypothetical protein